MTTNKFMEPVDVKYIGKLEPWFDRLYDTGLSFTCGQTRRLPWDMAPKFLRHSDIFEEYKPLESLDDNEPPLVDLIKPKKSDDQPPLETLEDNKPDDTQQLLEEQEVKNKEKEDKQLEKQALYDQVNSMDKDAVENFIDINYQQNLDKRGSIETVRAKAIAIIDEFGAF